MKITSISKVYKKIVESMNEVVLICTDVSNIITYSLPAVISRAKVHKEVTKDEKVRNHVHYPPNSRR